MGAGQEFPPADGMLMIRANRTIRVVHATLPVPVPRTAEEPSIYSPMNSAGRILKPWLCASPYMDTRLIRFMGISSVPYNR